MQPYLPCTDLWVITTYYNPASYRARRENYARCVQPFKDAGIPLVTVECAFGQEPFSLAPAPDVIQVRGRDRMWLKERLINLAVAALPPAVTKVAWIDADILFTNPAWAQEAAALLDRWPLVQLFERVASLERGQRPPSRRDDLSFASRQRMRRTLSLRTPPGRTYHRYGAYGFAWAATRDLLQRPGLYDRAIIGGGDQLVARAASGEIDFPGVRSVVGAEPRRWPTRIDKLLRWLADRRRPQWWLDWRVAAAAARLDAVPAATFRDDYRRWATQWYSRVRGQIGVVPGRILHLWHGELAQRQYSARNAILARHHFLPARDLRLNADGVWEWASDKPLLQQEILAYFQARQEDGDTG